MTYFNSGVSLQAIPEDSDLFRAACKDYQVAEALQYFQALAFGTRMPPTPVGYKIGKWKSIYAMARKIGTTRYSLKSRCLYTDGHTFEAISYLLSFTPQDKSRGKDTSLIHDAFYGEESLHSKAFTMLGMPIGFVTAARTRLIAEYLGTITYDIMHEHFDTEASRKARIYKITEGEEQFDDIWGQFVDMRKMYQATAEHNEAVITEVHFLIH